MLDGSDTNGMDCADIVIGAAVGRLSRVKDYYTPDRSTPRQDQFYGGTQSLTAAIARQSDTGITTLIFRRPLIGIYFFHVFYYSHRPIGQVWIYLLLFVFCLFICTVTDFSGENKAGGVKFVRWFIGVLGRKSPILVNFAPPEAQNRTNRPPTRK